MSSLPNGAAGQQDVTTLIAQLQRDEPTLWSRAAPPPAWQGRVTGEEIEAARARFARFEPVLAALFPHNQWDGRIRSSLVFANDRLAPGAPPLFLKADSELPMTGSVKARGGVHELLCWIEDFAEREGLLSRDEPTIRLLDPKVRARLARGRIVVASTGNLGFSIGLVARAFGCAAEIHMSRDAKGWKKERLRKIGATVVEHDGDYAETVARARVAAAAENAYFVDDENSRRLFVGYAVAADELAEQIADRGFKIGPDQPLVVYLPCGVGGAPGGITAGLRHRFGDAVIPVFVEPTRAPCMLVALATGGMARPVYEFGLDNQTLADGLAVPTASPLVLSLVGDQIPAAIAINDDAMVAWVQRAWRGARLRLEPSAAAAIAAHPIFTAERSTPAQAVHVAWLTGGSLLPDSEFDALLDIETAFGRPVV